MALFKNKLKTFQEQAAQEKEALQAQIEQLKKEKGEAALECINLQAKVTEQKEVIAQVTKQGKQLQEQNDRLQQMQEAAQEIGTELRNENEALQKQLTVLQAQLAEHKTALVQSQEANEDLLQNKYKRVNKVRTKRTQALRPLKGKKMPEKLRQVTQNTATDANTTQAESIEAGAMTHNALGQVKTQAEFQNVPVNMGSRMIAPRVRRR
jgi:chromosome segregation ATPase